MVALEQFFIGQGISAHIPHDWEVSAESSDGQYAKALQFKTSTCNAQIEFLNRHDLSSAEFVSTYRYQLMVELEKLNLSFEDFDSLHPNEILASGSGVLGRVVHILIPSDPVVHLSAIVQNQSDILQLRLIANSLEINQSVKFNSDDDFLPIPLNQSWQEIVED